MIYYFTVPLPCLYFKIAWTCYAELVLNFCIAGTALYVYNDAVFTVEDWNGIQEIARSRKREDPLKVGRFGIGFNSVYHVTGEDCLQNYKYSLYFPARMLIRGIRPKRIWKLSSEILLQALQKFPGSHPLPCRGPISNLRRKNEVGVKRWLLGLDYDF